MLLLARERNLMVGNAVVLNGIAVVAAMATTALRLFQQTGTAVSRQGTYAKAPPEAIAEFLQSRPGALLD